MYRLPYTMWPSAADDRPGQPPRTIRAALRDAALRLGGGEEQLRAAQEAEIRRLAVVVEYRDTDTGGHIERMSEYAGLVAEHVGLPPRVVADLRLAAALHDVGKVAVPDSILLK